MNWLCAITGLMMLWASVSRGWAAGSGLNVLLVVNQASADSVALGNYYAERRQVPPQNYLRIQWPGNNAQWSNGDFTTNLLRPLLSAIQDRQLGNQISYVVLCMDIPYRVTQSGGPLLDGQNSTTAALFYGFKPDLPASPAYDLASCNLPYGSSNSYAGSEASFRSAQPNTALTNSYLAVMITASNLLQAKTIVDQGVLSDASFATQTVILSKSWDGARNIRYRAFDNTIFNARVRGNYHIIRDLSAQPLGITNLLGYETGMYQFSISPNTFVPGAIADSLTSYAGLLYESNDQTTLLAFLNSGASGSYGTIVEPCAYLEKFPSPQVYFYQSRGFSLAECYYQSVTNPYQGLIVGEPLAAPFALPPAGAWQNLPPGALLSGLTNIGFVASALDAAHPVQQVDLFLDGIFLQGLTNISPTPENILSLSIAGHRMDYVIAPGATLSSACVGLADLCNDPTNTTATGVVAFPHGDRLELQAISPAATSSGIPVSFGASAGTAAPLTTGVYATKPGFLDSIAYGIRGFQISGTPTNGSYLHLTITKTNGMQVTLSATNSYGTNSLFQMAQQLIGSLNSHPALSGPDGLTGQDVLDTTYGDVIPHSDFNLVVNAAGPSAAQIQANLISSPELSISPGSNVTVDENRADLQPRAHLYLTAGVTNLPLLIPLDTTSLADGYHELTAVVYEGSHVQVQGRVSRPIVIRNTPLSANLTLVAGGSNTAVESTLQFAVTAGPGAISTVELFSTGGSLGIFSNQPNALFSVPCSYLGVGLHPFYAIVTSSGGAKYRTETTWIRIVGSEPPFELSFLAAPWELSWPATVGRSYDIFSTTSTSAPLELRSTILATNSPAQWSEPMSPAGSRFYRVRTSN